MLADSTLATRSPWAISAYPQEQLSLRHQDRMQLYSAMLRVMLSPTLRGPHAIPLETIESAPARQRALNLTGCGEGRSYRQGSAGGLDEAELRSRAHFTARRKISSVSA